MRSGHTESCAKRIVALAVLPRSAYFCDLRIAQHSTRVLFARTRATSRHFVVDVVALRAEIQVGWIATCRRIAAVEHGERGRNRTNHQRVSDTM